MPLDGLRGPRSRPRWRPDEILVRSRRGPLPAGVGGAYVNLEQPASGYSIVGVAAVLGHAHGVLGSETIDHVRVAITGVGPAPYRAKAVEAALAGTSCSRDRSRPPPSKATEGIEVNSDIHADRGVPSGHGGRARQASARHGPGSLGLTAADGCASAGSAPDDVRPPRSSARS